MNITDETIETFKRAAFDRMMDDDGCPEGEQIRAGLAAVFAATRPGDELPGGLVVEQGWQTMETALMDGTHILVCLEGPPFGQFWTFAQNPPTVAHWFGPPDSPGLRAGGWYLSVQQNDGGRIRPTHWRHLPATPKGGDANG